MIISFKTNFKCLECTKFGKLVLDLKVITFSVIENN